MIDVAIDAAKQAGALAFSYFGKIKNASLPAWQVSYKGDNSPVTIADVEAEKLIRKIITKNFPDHGIIGEELGSKESKSLPAGRQAKYQWVIDPIDGTKRFAIGHQYWSVLIAVLEDNKPIIGISFFPATDEFFQAQKGKGAFLNGRRLKVSSTTKLQEATVCYGSLTHFTKINKNRQVIEILKSTRTSLGDGYSVGHNFLLKGKIDATFETGHIWDFAAPSMLVEEAGGEFTDFAGKKSLTSGNALATNGLLHNQILKILGE